MDFQGLYSRCTKYEYVWEWEKYSRGAHHAAKRNGWFSECSRHMKRLIKTTNFYTKTECKRIGMKYGSRGGEWRSKDAYSWGKARRMGWLDECCKHMKPSKTGKKAVICKETGEIFESAKAASKKLRVNDTKIGLVCKDLRKKTGGYTFEYFNKKKKKIRSKSYV